MRRRRAGDPRRCHGRPLRAPDHDRAAGRGRATRAGPRGGSDARRASDDRAPRAPGQRSSCARGPTRSPSTPRPRPTSPTPPNCPETRASSVGRRDQSRHTRRGARGHRRHDRHGPLHDRQPWLGRPGLHRALPDRSSAALRNLIGPACRARGRWRDRSAHRPGLPRARGPTSSSPARPSSRPPTQARPTGRSRRPSRLSESARRPARSEAVAGDRGGRRGSRSGGGRAAAVEEAQHRAPARRSPRRSRSRSQQLFGDERHHHPDDEQSGRGQPAG